MSGIYTHVMDMSSLNVVPADFRGRMRLTRHLAVFCLAVGLAAAPLPAAAASLSFTGNLAQDDSVALFGFTVAVPGSVTLRSFSYAGGSNGAGAAIVAGGFDPTVSLFTASGLLVLAQDDATPECDGVANDPVTNDCFDVNLVTELAAGNYLVAVTQFDNAALGPDLAAGFSKSGANFTAMFGCVAGQFCDVSAESRTSFWAVDVSGDSVLAAVPAPAAGLLLGTALAGLGLARWRRRAAGVLSKPTAHALAALLVLPAWLGMPQYAFAQAVPTCNGKTATIVGTAGDDVLRGSKLPDVIVGLGGNDTITGASGNDTICAGPGNDTIFAGNGHDFVDGGSGGDTILGGFGNDLLRGGLGNDQVNGETGADNCDGGVGQDSALGGCETVANFGLTVKQVRVPVWDGSFTPGDGLLAGQPQTALDGALFVPAGATRKIAVLATHGAFGGYNRGLVGWLGWWLEPYGITTLVLNRRDSTDYGPSEGGGNTLYPQSMCDLKSGVEYLVDTLGYEGVVILGHSKGTSMAPVYPGNFRLCGPDVAGSPAANDPRVAGVVTFGSIADNREASTIAPWAGPSYEEEQFPGLNCGSLLYDCNVAQAEAEVAAGRGDDFYEFIAGILTGNGSILSVTLVLTPNSALSYYGPDTLGVPEREALKLEVPFLIVHADGDSVTPVTWSDRMYDTLLTAGKDVSYFKPPYQTLYPNGGPRDPNRGQPAHSLNAEGARWDFVESLNDWMVGVIPAAGEAATAVDMGSIAALPDFDPPLVPTEANPELP